MALFGKTKKSAQGGSQPKADAPRAQTSNGARDLSFVLKHARITEKATMHQSSGVYTFDVGVRATKRDIIQAVRALYKVTPRKVRVVSIPVKQRRSMRTGRSGMSGGGKKAYVYLKAGETINF